MTEGCRHYYADPSGGFGWPSCVKCGAPAPTEAARVSLYACCRQPADGDHAPGCRSIAAMRENRERR